MNISAAIAGTLLLSAIMPRTALPHRPHRRGALPADLDLSDETGCEITGKDRSTCGSVGYPLA